MADNLTPQQRSYCMSRIKRKDTGIEKQVRSELHKRGYRFRKHVRDLPGKPDIVFPKAKVVVFLDGDFWHGNNWNERKIKLKKKIGCTRERDQRNFGKLRAKGWRVIRLWQHEVKRNLDGCVARITAAVKERS